MRKRAFTLLETMIALVVVASAIAASSQASRVLFRSAAQSELVAQASMLADDAAASLQRTGAILVANSIDVRGYFALAGSTTSRQVFPYRRYPNNGDFYTQYYCLDNLEQAGNSGSGCGTTRSDVLTNGASYTAATIFSGGGEVIAVNRAAPLPETRSVVDVTTTTSVGGDEVEDTDENWDFYRRNIIVRARDQLIGSTKAVEAVVTVTSLGDSSVSVQRSFLISLQP